MSKFFTYEERLNLQKFLKDSLSFKEISRRMKKTPTTISREGRKYSSEVATGYPGFPFNGCKNRFDCRKKKVCKKECTRKSDIYCKLCSSCNTNCDEFIEQICTARFRIPYVCNGCEIIGKCSLLKTIYDAEHAHIKSQEAISQSRSGLCVSEEEITRLNKIISPLIQNGQSVNQVYRIGRNYEAFTSYMEKNPDTPVVQMDSVIGSKGGKCLLTIHFVECSLMLAFLREANTSKSVINVFNDLDAILGEKEFSHLFQIILTDNGSEFSNPKAIEYRENFLVIEAEYTIVMREVLIKKVQLK